MKDIKSYYNLQKLMDIRPDMNTNYPFGFIDKGKGEAVYLNDVESKRFV